MVVEQMSTVVAETSKQLLKIRPRIGEVLDDLTGRKC
jgi:hypothetical protein